MIFDLSCFQVSQNDSFQYKYFPIFKKLKVTYIILTTTKKDRNFRYHIVITSYIIQCCSLLILNYFEHIKITVYEKKNSKIQKNLQDGIGGAAVF